jgi:hypothetical protein
VPPKLPSESRIVCLPLLHNDFLGVIITAPG